MANQGERTPSPLDLLGGGLLIVIGVILGVTGGNPLLWVFITAAGIAIVVYGIVRRRRLNA